MTPRCAGHKRKAPASAADAAFESPKRSRTSDIAAPFNADVVQHRADQNETASNAAPAPESIEIDLNDFDDPNPLSAETPATEEAEVAVAEDGAVDWKILPFAEADIKGFYPTNYCQCPPDSDDEEYFQYPSDNEDNQGCGSDGEKGEDNYDDDPDSMDLDGEPEEMEAGTRDHEAMEINDAAMNMDGDSEVSDDGSYQLWYMVGNMPKQAVVSNVVLSPDHWHI